MSEQDGVTDLRLRVADAIVALRRDGHLDNLPDDPVTNLTLGLVWLDGRGDGLLEGKAIHDRFVEAIR